MPRRHIPDARLDKRMSYLEIRSSNYTEALSRADFGQRFPNSSGDCFRRLHCPFPLIATFAVFCSTRDGSLAIACNGSRLDASFPLAAAKSRAWQPVDIFVRFSSYLSNGNLLVENLESRIGSIKKFKSPTGTGR
jgi:hypothetical protein